MDLELSFQSMAKTAVPFPWTWFGLTEKSRGWSGDLAGIFGKESRTCCYVRSYAFAFTPCLGHSFRPNSRLSIRPLLGPCVSP